MAIPFFILAGNFLTHGGVARRMIDFATSLVGHWYGGLALAGVSPARCSRGVRLVAGDRGGDRIDHPARDGRAGLPKRFGAGVITVAGSLGILMPPSIPMVIYAVSTNTSIGELFIAGIAARHRCSPRMLGATTWYPRAGATTIRACRRRRWAESAATRSAKSIWGLLLIVIVIGGIYSGIFTADRGRGGERRLCVLRRGVRLQEI